MVEPQHQPFTDKAGGPRTQNPTLAIAVPYNLLSAISHPVLVSMPLCDNALTNVTSSTVRNVKMGVIL